jgi:hypothetical protein
MIYSREALRRFRERQSQQVLEADSLLEQVPPDAPMADAVFTAWDGEQFVEWHQWRARTPAAAEGTTKASEANDADVTCIVGDCGSTRIWLVKNGRRWFMYAGSRKSRARRRDFASPFLGHAKKTAEGWYGMSRGGWRIE